MPKLYNFDRLINKYSVPFEIVMEGAGGYADGEWIAGTPVVEEVTGAIVPLPERKIYQSGGVLSAKDKQLYMTKPIAQALQKAKVRYKGELYNIEEETDYSDYADANVYLLKRVSISGQKEGAHID